MSEKNRILVLFAHPAFHKSTINKRMIHAIQDLEGVTIHKLYDEYPDYYIDVPREQKLLLEHDIIVWHHPFYWYSAPPILKEWIDLVLQHNFAYGSKGTALKGKMVMTAITAGGRKMAYEDGGYNVFPIRTFLSPFEQTARLCRMFYLPPFVVFGTHLLEDAVITRYAEDYRQKLIGLRDNLIDTDAIISDTFINEII